MCLLLRTKFFVKPVSLSKVYVQMFVTAYSWLFYCSLESSVDGIETELVTLYKLIGFP